MPRACYSVAARQAPRNCDLVVGERGAHPRCSAIPRVEFQYPMPTLVAENIALGDGGESITKTAWRPCEWPTHSLFE